MLPMIKTESKAKMLPVKLMYASPTARHPAVLATVRSKAVGSAVVYCFSRCLWRFCVRSLFCYVVRCVLSSTSASITLRKTELVALLLFSSCYLVTVIIFSLFLTVPWLGLQYVTVAFPGPKVLKLFHAQLK